MWGEKEHLIGMVLQLFLNAKDYLYIYIFECPRGTRAMKESNLKSQFKY